MAEPKQPRWFRTAGGRPGRARRALDAALAGADLGGSRAITAELARDAADLVDSARAAQDPKLWSTAAARLEQLLDRLGVRRDGDDAGAASAHDDRGRDPWASVPPGLARALGVSPEARDVADAGPAE